METFDKYRKKLNEGCDRLEEYFLSLDEYDDVRKLLYDYYAKKSLDADGYARRMVYDVDCTADGLVTFYQICHFKLLEVYV